MDKGKTCCFTGHRRIPPEDIPFITHALQTEIENQIRQGVLYFGIGGAIGFDTLAALCVLALKEKYHSIRLILVLPCRGQEKFWSKAQQTLYLYILKQADKAVFLSDSYYRGCMQKRNRYLVDHSDLCICYLTNFTGGTKYTVDYCIKKEIPVINLADQI